MRTPGVRFQRQSGVLATLLACFVTTLLVAPAGAGPSEVRVRDAREVRDVDFVPRREAHRASQGRSDRSMRRRAARLAFEAEGRRFEIDLDENLELLEDLPEATRRSLRSRHEVYRGSLAGRPGTWVRLTRSGRHWKGLVWDGEELLAIEPSAGLPGRFAPASELALMRARDVAMSGSCALDPGHDPEPEPSAEGMLDGFEALPPSLAAAGSELRIALVGDPSYAAGQSDPEGTALAVMNAVDGIYASQIGVSLRVVDLLMLSTPSGLTSNDAGVLLDQLQDLTLEGPVENPGLVHLLTGRNLDGSTIGIAYLGVLCHPRYGIGLSQFQPQSITANAILVAHEIGHNFGAPHDNQTGSVCGETASGYIMNPWLNSNADAFSGCSVNEMASEIASATCLVDLADEPLPECSNGLDDDGDGFADYGDDIGCTDPSDPSETTECRDGYDNDYDGLVDYPEDPECLSEDQWSELDPNCGLGFEIALILPWVMRLRRRR